MNKLFATGFAISAYTAVDAFQSGNIIALAGALIIGMVAFMWIEERK